MYEVLTFWSCAMETHEPCQEGNLAALSETFRVPQGCRSRAVSVGNVWGDFFNTERTGYYI